MAATLRTLTAKSAAALDAELMSTAGGGFTLAQLMELAGLSVAQALYTLSPPSSTPKVLIACGPGNNGGDGLVAARHLVHFGYTKVSVYFPKQGREPHYEALRRQLEGLKGEGVGFVEKFEDEVEGSDCVVDAIFGFSFTGEVREPFVGVIAALERTRKVVLAVDAPSSWNIETGPPEEGVGKDYMPTALISLTAPKPLVKFFKGRHFVGGRFVGKEIAEKHGFDVPPYKGAEQIVEISTGGDEKL
jgi:NAD(P)H-hydrate epimerase